MAVDWAPFVEIVHRHQRFLLTTHVRPDADGLGSVLAMSAALEQLGKSCRLVVASPWPPRYRFLDPAGRLERFTLPGDPWRDAQVVLIFDTGTWGQLGDFGVFLRQLPAVKVVIDHHLSQDDLEATRFLDVGAEATARLTWEAIQALGVALTPSMADQLFAGLAMDTGWFRHANTRPETFTLAALLMSAGAAPPVLYEQLFEQNSLARLRLTARVLQRLEVAAQGRIAYTWLKREDYADTGAHPADTEELVNYPRSVAGVEVALFFMEQPQGGVKVSFRSRQLDVAALASRFGGGGHRLAAGATFEAPLEQVREQVLAATQAALDGAGGASQTPSAPV